MTKADKPLSRIGRFQILAEHGRDGIARIVTATDTNSSLMVTLDIIDHGNAEERKTVLDWAKRCQSVKDRQIFSIIEILDNHQPPLIVREYERGASLGQILGNDGPMPPHEAGRLIAGFARVLDRCHARRLVHGRLSIELIRLASDDSLKIASFGRPQLPLDTPGTHIERLRFAAPEQYQGELASEASDLYSLGLIFYNLLAGKPAFTAQDQMLLAAQAGEADVPDIQIAAPHIPDAIAGIVTRLVAKDPNSRFRTGNQLAETIERTLASIKPVSVPQGAFAQNEATGQAAKPSTEVYWPGRILVIASIVILCVTSYLVWREARREDMIPKVCGRTNRSTGNCSTTLTGAITGN